jgi:hypothetical protein
MVDICQRCSREIVKLASQGLKTRACTDLVVQWIELTFVMLHGRRGDSLTKSVGRDACSLAS